MRWPLHALVFLLLFFASGEALASTALGPEVEVDPGVFVGTEGSLPAVAWDGTNYFVVSGGPGCCSSPSVLSGTRVSANGTVLDLGGIALDAAGGTAAVGYGAGYFLVATTNCDVIRVASNGTVADSTPISLASRDDRSSRSASHLRNSSYQPGAGSARTASLGFDPVLGAFMRDRERQAPVLCAGLAKRVALLCADNVLEHRPGARLHARVVVPAPRSYWQVPLTQVKLRRQVG